MGEFGWAYISGAVKGRGVTNAVQFLESAEGLLTGSHKFTFDNTNDNLFVTGSVYVSGTLHAQTFDIIKTNVVELSSSGDSNFGNDPADSHIFTGSVTIVSGALSRHYHKLLTTPYTVEPYDAIIGVSSSGYVSITLPAASATKSGTQLIIKDEYNITRTKSGGTHIALSGAGGDTIDHQTTYDIEGSHVALSVYCDGSKWFIY